MAGRYVSLLLLPLALVALARAEIDAAADEAACVGQSGTPFVVTGTVKLMCCRAPNVVTWVDQGRKMGNCCPEGYGWVGDKATGKGGCCPAGHLWTLGQCKPAVNDPPVSISSPPVSGGGGGVLDAVRSVLTGVSKEAGKDSDAGQDGKDDDPNSTPPDDEATAPTDVNKTPVNATGQGGAVCHAGIPVCGSDKDLGIRYGHCYILSFADGTQLGAQRDNPTYAKGGYLQDVPFKVCQATSHCAQGAVPRNGSFYLQDQVGRFDDPAGKLGWIDGATGGTHMKFVTNPKKAGLFRGTPQCSKGECSVKLQGGNSGHKGLSPTGPTANHGLTFRQNPRIGVTLRFTETSCANDYDPYF